MHDTKIISFLEKIGKNPKNYHQVINIEYKKYTKESENFYSKERQFFFL